MNALNAADFIAGQLSGLTTAAANFSIGQIDALSSNQISSLSAAGLNRLSATQLGNLSSTQIGGLSVTQIARLSITTLNNLTPTQTGDFSSTQVEALSAGQINGLSTANLNALNVGEFTTAPERALTQQGGNTDYFSINGGVTNLGDYNPSNSSVDYADWSTNMGTDPFGDAFPDATQPMSDNDAIEVAAIGWDPTAKGTTLAQTATDKALV